MRVALLAPLFESVPPRLYGGTERVVYHLCRGLIENNIEVTLFASGDSSVDGEIDPIIPEGLRLRKVPVTDAGIFHFKMLARVADRANEFDVIHNHHDYWMLPLARMVSVPLVTTLHGRLDIPGMDDTLRAFSRGAYVSISDSQRSSTNQNWIRTVYNGVDVSPGLFKEKPGRYLAFLGRICAEKRPEWAIQIALESGVPLLIAAKIEGAAGAQYYDAYVKPHVDGRFIQYVGEISESEKAEFLGEALALVFPIDWPEPFGLVMAESLACGTPVLARPCGSVREIVTDGVTGFLEMDITSLAQKVKDVASLDRRECRRVAVERFSFMRMTKDYIDVYRAVIEQAKNRDESRAHRHRRDLLHSIKCSPDGDPEDQFQG